ncbi:MAG: type II toxin-antitoxin system HicB family antitoxin [Limisphaerales bacterium]
MKVHFTEELWREGAMYVSYAPELDMAACGETAQQARQNLREVVQISFRDMRERGTLAEYLREAGFPTGAEGAEEVRLDKELIGFEPVAIAL